jgi:signal peptidase I
VTPLELLALVCIFAIVRVALSLKPDRAVLATNGAGMVQSRGHSTRRVIREYLDAFIVAGLVALFLITFVVRTFFIPTGSMEPTLLVHDVLLTNQFQYRLSKPNHGDVVVFTPPIPSPDDFIKRLIGMPGDTIRIHGGIVYRNGVALVEPYIAAPPNYELEIKNYGIYVDGSPLDPKFANIPPRSTWTAPDKIPDGFYFMMGDNRINSEDSHFWGFAQTGGTFVAGQRKGQKAGFTGRAFTLIYPLNRIRIIK